MALSDAYKYATAEGGIGADALYNNINQFLATNPSQQAINDAMAQYGVSQEDVDYAKSLLNPAPSGLSAVTGGNRPVLEDVAQVVDSGIGGLSQANLGASNVADTNAGGLSQTNTTTGGLTNTTVDTTTNTAQQVDTAAIQKKLTDQILGQNLTSQWTGEGFGSVQANAADMAKILSSAGITDIKQLGVKQVQVPESSGEWGYTPAYTQTVYFNKDTGQELGNTYGERQTGNFFGGTYAGKGNTGYGVQFDAQGNPYFYTQGASSSDIGDLQKVLAVASFIPGVAPFAQGLNAVIAAGQGNLTGAVLNTLGAAGSAGFTDVGGLPINDAKNIVGGLTALQNKDPFGVINAGMNIAGSTLPSEVRTAVNWTNFGNAVANNDLAGMLSGAGALTQSRDLTLAGTATKFINAMNRFNQTNNPNDLNVALSAGQSLSSYISNYSSPTGKTTSKTGTVDFENSEIARLKGLGYSNAQISNYLDNLNDLTASLDFTDTSGLSDIGLAAFRQAKAAGATDVEALAAANLATGSGSTTDGLTRSLTGAETEAQTETELVVTSARETERETEFETASQIIVTSGRATARETARETETEIVVTSARETFSPTETETEVVVISGRETPRETETEIVITSGRETFSPTETETEIVVTSGRETKTETETLTEIVVTSGRETKTETETEIVVTSGRETKTETETEIVVTSGRETKTETESETETLTEIVVTTSSETKTETETETETITEIVVTTSSETKTETETETLTETETEIVVTTGRETKTETETESETITEIVVTTSSETQTETETETATKIVTATLVTYPAKPITTSTGMGGVSIAGGSGKPIDFLKEQLLKTYMTKQSFKDPLAEVRKAQQELMKENIMQQGVDPRLAAILAAKMTGGEQEASTTYNYGKEPDNIEDILNLRDSADQTYKAGGYVQPLMAQGGMALPLLAAKGGLPTMHKGREDFRDGKHVAGEGDGQSDDIPAMLADGEFVFPADVVSALGNGSTKAGTDKLYEMMHSIRDRARSKGPKDLPPPALKSPLDYLKKR